MKTKLFFIALLLGSSIQLHAQFSKALSKLKDKVNTEILGTSEQQQTNKPGGSQKEPECACNDGSFVLKFNDQYKINYKETQLCLTPDGKVLLQSRLTDGSNLYYISNRGQISGPYNENSPELKSFPCFDNEYNFPFEKYIIKQGNKSLIRFKGKEYGPFAEVNKFLVTKSGDKFVAMTIKDRMFSAINEEEAEKMNQAGEQERIAMAMQLGTKAQEEMQEQLKNGGELDIMPKLTTNIPNVKWDMMSGDDIRTSMKYDEFCIVLGNQIKDLNGNTILTLKDNVDFNGDNLWISSDNKRYAWFEYGTLHFSDGKELNEVAEVGLQKDGNGICLSYFYYSPGEDAIKMCKIAF